MIKLALNASIFGALSYAVAAAEEGTAATGFWAWMAPFIIISLLIVINGLYVSAEFAIIGTRPSQMEELARQGNSAAQQVLNVLEDSHLQDQYIATAQLGITIASLFLGMYAEPAIEHLIAPYLSVWLDLSALSVRFATTPEALLELISYILVISFITYLHVVVGEMVPKSMALSDAASTAMRLNLFMRLSRITLTPLVRVLNSVGALLLRVVNLPPAKPRVHSAEEIVQIVGESADGGFINDDERDIIQNIFDFSERYAAQVMTPRRKVQALPVDVGLDELMNFVAASTHNRFPVYDGTLDHVIGILHMHNIIKQQLYSKGHFDLRLLLKPAPAVPEDTPVEDLLAIFKHQRIHMAVVLDEFGGMAGVVTLEDLVEEVVGEVQDEFDVENAPYVELEPGLLELAGSYLLGDLLDDVDLGDHDELPEVETVGGLVVTELGRPPLEGDELTLNGTVHFRVLAVDGLAIARLQVRFPTDEKAAEPPAEK